jgi:hypothetical protein
MKIEVRLAGTPAHKRYMILRQNAGVEEYWNGEGWSPTRGVLYYTEQDMARDFEKLQMEQVAHLPERVFVAPVIIRVRSDKDFTLDELKRHLFAASRLHLDHEKGQGPVPGSVAFLDIEWNEAKEITPDGGVKAPGDRESQA